MPDAIAIGIIAVWVAVATHQIRDENQRADRRALDLLLLEGGNDTALRPSDAFLRTRVHLMALRMLIRAAALDRSLVRAVYAVLLLAILFIHKINRLARHYG